MAEDSKRRWKGIVLNWPEIALNDNSEDKHRPLTELQSAVLLGAIEAYRWHTRWQGLSISKDELDELIAEIKDRLMREAVSMSCEDVEDCLEESPTITTIETTITTIETNITEIEEAQTEIEEAIEELQNAPDGGNITPPLASYENEFLCNAAEYIVDQLIQKITDVWADAASITLEEFLRTLLFGGGWDASLLNQLWELAVTMSNPNLVDEVTDARQTMINIFGCDGLDRANFIAQVDGDSSITDDAQAAIIGAVNAVTNAQFSQWAFIGSLTASGDCMCPNTKVWDFSLGQMGWIAQGGRATFNVDGWTSYANPYGLTIVIEKSFTWPSDMVITQMRLTMENRSGASFKYFYGVPYVNGNWTAFDYGAEGVQNSVPVDKGTRSGLGFEFSIFTEIGQKVTRIEVDFSGTESPNW